MRPPVLPAGPTPPAADPPRHLFDFGGPDADGWVTVAPRRKRSEGGGLKKIQTGVSPAAVLQQLERKRRVAEDESKIAHENAAVVREREQERLQKLQEQQALEALARAEQLGPFGNRSESAHAARRSKVDYTVTRFH